MQIEILRNLSAHCGGMVGCAVTLNLILRTTSTSKVYQVAEIIIFKRKLNQFSYHKFQELKPFVLPPEQTCGIIKAIGD